MSPKLVQRMIEFSNDSLKQFFESDFYRKGLTTSSPEEANRIAHRFHRTVMETGPFWVESLAKAGKKTLFKEEKVFIEKSAENAKVFAANFVADSSKAFGQPPHDMISAPKSKIITEYEKHLKDVFDSEIIAGSIVPFLVAILPAMLTMIESYKQMKKNPLFGDKLQAIAIFASEEELNKIKAVIDLKDRQISAEVESQLKKILKKSLDYEIIIWNAFYQGLHVMNI